METSQEIKKVLQRKDEEEALAQSESISHRGSSGLGKIGKLNLAALEFLVETLEGFEAAHGAVPYPSPLVWTGMLARKIGVSRKTHSPCRKKLWK